jgi:hypothetical protein
MEPLVISESLSEERRMKASEKPSCDFRVRSHAPSIRSYRGTKVVWPDFQPMRVPVEPVCIDLFRQNPVFTSLHLKSPVHVVQPPITNHLLWKMEVTKTWHQCYGSEMCTPDPDLFSIPDTGSNNTKKRGENKLVVLPFFYTHKFLKIEKLF